MESSKNTLPREYAMIVFRFWKVHVSGWILAMATIVTSIFAAIFINDASTSAHVVKLTAVILVIASLGVIWGAQYDAWKEERSAKEKAEEELSSQADMQGQIWVQIMAYDPYEQTPPKNSGLLVTCDCSNYGRKTCEISKILLILKTPHMEQYRFIQQLEPQHVKQIPHGQQFLATFEVKIPNVKTSRLCKSEITLYLVDSLKIEYSGTTTIVSNRGKIALASAGDDNQ